MKPITVLLLLCALCLVSYGRDDIPIHQYTINIIPRADRTELEINLSFLTNFDSAVLVKMPTDYYGTPDLYKYVKSFKVIKGHAQDRQSKELRIRPDAGRVEVRYVLSYDSANLSNYAFAPNTGPGHFHTAGCQWMLPVGNINDTIQYRIIIDRYPPNWKLYSSLGSNARSLNIRATYRNLISSAMGGVESKNFRTFFIKGKQVSVSIAGNFALGKESIFNALHKIVFSERDWFNDFGQEFYHIAVNPKPDVLSGTSVNNLFVCFAKTEALSVELLNLFAHEMVHYWLPVKISFEGEPTVKFEWLFEGFPEYIGRKILLENKLITTNDFIDFINADLNNLTDNPYSQFKYEELSAQASKRYGSLEKKISYYRGALMAMNWDARIMERFPGRSLKDVMVELNAMAKAKPRLVPSDFFHLLNKYGIDGESDFGKFILEGNRIPMVLPSFIADHELYTLHRPVFNLGFDMLETRRTNVMTGVEENGPAWDVGLRNGMEVIRYHNVTGSWPFRNPVKVVVKDTGNVANEYSYFPTGKIMALKQARKKTLANNN